MPTPNTPNANTQRYPGFVVERFGRVGERGSYTLRFKLRAVEFSYARAVIQLAKLEREEFSGWIESASSAAGPGRRQDQGLS